MRRNAAARQAGVAAVEFALVSVLFFTVLIGVVEMGRLLWVWNAAVEGTRLGARLAVVCDIGDADIKLRMTERVPELTTSQIVVSYLPTGCDSGNCKEVRVELINYTHATLLPNFSIVPASIRSVTLPKFSTTLRKEFMQSTGNSVCN
jgi:Flp pilus assembly pilin Flp